jgi:hypothetical protein
MEICVSRDAFARDLDAGGSPECGFELLEIGKALEASDPRLAMFEMLHGVPHT